MKRINRLLKDREFKEVIDHKLKLFNRSFTCYYCKKEEPVVKIGISVSKKIGHAVLRNKIKRQVRMMCQEIFPINLNYSIIVIISKNYSSLSFEENKANLYYIYKKITHEVN